MSAFIAVEGCEGSGKSTQVRRLAALLRESGWPVAETHEPGDTDAGRLIRQLLLTDDVPLTPRAEALLFAADRAQHVEELILPALRAGTVVVCDRYIASSVAYQGEGRYLGPGEVASLGAWASGEVLPDLTILLDIDPAEGLRRAAGRRGGPDRLEREKLLFHRRVRESFLRQAALDASWVVLDAALPCDDLAEMIAAHVNQALLELAATRMAS